MACCTMGIDRNASRSFDVSATRRSWKLMVGSPGLTRMLDSPCGRRPGFRCDEFFDLLANRPAIGQKLVVDPLPERSHQAGVRYRVFRRSPTTLRNQAQDGCIACIGKPAFSRTGRND